MSSKEAFDGPKLLVHVSNSSFLKISVYKTKLYYFDSRLNIRATVEQSVIEVLILVIGSELKKGKL